MQCAWTKPVRTRRFRPLNADPWEVLTLRRCALLGAILVLIAALRIGSTYTVLSHTVDEPVHLGAGMEWLDHGTMTGDVSHPPMARVLSALGPWLAGAPGAPPGNDLSGGAVGVAVGLGMIAKYSVLVFLPAIFVAMYLCQWRGMRAIPGQLREHWRPAMAAAAIACLVIWGGFRFSFGPLSFAHVSLPAPRFFDGLKDVWDHNENGHASYILGERHHFGVWYFFPVTLGVKTPLAMLLLVGWSLWTAGRKRLNIASPSGDWPVIPAFALTTPIHTRDRT